MKKSAVFAVLLFLVSLSAAAAPAERNRDDAFPTVSKFQVREPISVARERAIKAQDHDACGSNPSLPYNCIYLCNNGVPMHYPNGEPQILCWYSPDEGGGAGCQAGNTCSSNVTCDAAPIYNGCDLLQYSCANC
jgi:hypothetical protein